MKKDVLVRDLDEETVEKLKDKAEAGNKSLQQELKDLLEFHAGPNKEEIKKRMEKIRKELKNSEKSFPDSADEIRKMREDRPNRLL